MPLFVVITAALLGGLPCNSSTTGATSSCTGAWDVCCASNENEFAGCCSVGTKCCANGCCPVETTCCNQTSTSSRTCAQNGICCFNGDGSIWGCCPASLPICCGDHYTCAKDPRGCPSNGLWHTSAQLAQKPSKTSHFLLSARNVEELPIKSE